MRTLCLALLLALQVTEPPEPYEGQREHRAPPEGWFCEAQNIDLSVPREHACNCERMCDDTGQIREDRNCTVFCHPKACKCPVGHSDNCKP